MNGWTFIKAWTRAIVGLPFVLVDVHNRLTALEAQAHVHPEVHTIPVPPGWSAEQAWEHIARHDGLPAYKGRPSWANVVVDPETKGLVRVLSAREEEDE